MKLRFVITQVMTAIVFDENRQ